MNRARSVRAVSGVLFPLLSQFRSYVTTASLGESIRGSP